MPLRSGLLAIIFLCGGLRAQKKPDWVTNPPTAGDYYIGINFASKSEGDYISIAKSRALNDLSSQIIVSINSETFLKTTEVENEVKQSFEETIKTNVQKDIEEYEQVDVWQNKTEYWVYLRLSKKAYYATRRKKFESAVSLAESTFQKAKELEASGDACQAMQLYVQSTMPLEPYLAETFDAELRKKSGVLFNGALSAAGEILAGIKVLALNKQIGIKENAGFKENLNCAVKYIKQGKETVVKNAPLKYESAKGKVDLVSYKSTTNDEGKSYVTLVSCAGEDGKASVKVSLDTEELLKGIAESALVAKAIKRKASPNDFFKIELQSLSIYFDANEKNIGKKLAVNVIEPALKDFFLEMGYTFVSSSGPADYIVKIESDTRVGGEAYGLRVSYLDANIVVMDNQQKEQIFSRQFTNIKGVKQDFPAAGSEAYRKVLTQNFKTELYPELKTKFQSK